MAGKLPSKADHGRCRRCPYSYMEIEESPDKWVEVPKNTKRIKGRRQFLHCTIYGRPCVRVAWNCDRCY